MGQKLHFQDNRAVSTKNIHLKKMTPFCLEIFSDLTTWRGDMGQKLHFYITIFDPLTVHKLKTFLTFFDGETF